MQDEVVGGTLFGMSDFEARFLDARIPRFTSIDPHSENYYSWSPYAYCANNPIRITDPTGMDWVLRYVDGAAEYYYDRSVTSQDDVNNKYGKDGGVIHIATGTVMTTFAKNGDKTQYTFTNDAEKNKYGTVTDTNGNVMDNSKIIYGNSYTIFGTSDNSVNAETLYKNFMGTSYTGPFNPKDYLQKGSYQYQPKNISEYPAMIHDRIYDHFEVGGASGAFFNSDVFPADMLLAIQSLNIARKPDAPAKERIRAAATGLFFFVVAGSKTSRYTSGATKK